MENPKIKAVILKKKITIVRVEPIIPKPVPELIQTSKDLPKYNFHIFVVDACSRSQGKRFLPKTIEFLEEKMEAHHFPFFNKVAWNSWPNGGAFLMGKYPTKDNIPPSITKPLCDNNNFEKHYIGNILQNMGYLTLFNEDVYSIFEKIFVNSTHKLFPLGEEVKKTKTYKDGLLYDDQCKSGLDYNIDMFSKFIDAYDVNIPKFSLNWNSQTSHDQLNYLWIADEKILGFLMKYQKELFLDFEIKLFKDFEFLKICVFKQ
uniref:Uncharacterized protein n=1 Tax=Panagrolaimus davidi TaxID=227884 RepID=A0A914QUU2_9BILA